MLNLNIPEKASVPADKVSALIENAEREKSAGRKGWQGGI
jgi:hypothetical protein